MSSNMNLRNLGNLGKSNTQLGGAIKENVTENNESNEDFGDKFGENRGRSRMSLSNMGRRMSVDSIGIGIRESIKQSATAITGVCLTKDINEAIQNIAQPEKTRSILRNNHGPSRHRWSELRQSCQGSVSVTGLNQGLRHSESRGGLRISESKQLRISESKQLRASESKQLRISESKTMQRSVSQRNFGSTFSFAEENEKAHFAELGEEDEEEQEEINYRDSQQFEMNYRDSQQFQDWSAAYLEKGEESSSSGEDGVFKEHSLEYDQEEKDRQG